VTRCTVHQGGASGRGPGGVCSGAWLWQLPWVQRRAPGRASGNSSRALWPGDIRGAPLGVGARGQRLEARPLHSTAPECLPVDAHRGHAGPPVLSAQGANGSSVLALPWPGMAGTGEDRWRSYSGKARGLIHWLCSEKSFHGFMGCGHPTPGARFGCHLLATGPGFKVC